MKIHYLRLIVILQKAFSNKATFFNTIYLNNLMKENPKFEFLEHTADIKFKVYGKALNEIFENSALAFSEYIASGKKIASKKGKTINVSGTDASSLLYNFLDELIYLLDAENFAVSKAEVTLRGNNLKAELYGDKASDYPIQQIKAATYAEMYIKKTPDSWEAQAVLDV